MCPRMANKISHSREILSFLAMYLMDVSYDPPTRGGRLVIYYMADRMTLSWHSQSVLRNLQLYSWQMDLRTRLRCAQETEIYGSYLITPRLMT
jgi:hypothetical protein